MIKKTKIFIVVLFLINSSCFSQAKYEFRLKGLYSYFADAAFFTDCATHKKYPVAFEKDAATLERAYLAVKEDDKMGEEIVVMLNGYFELRDKLEGSGKEEVLIVTKFENIFPHITCSGNSGTAKLKNTFWALREIYGEKIKTGNLKEGVHVILNGNNVKGFAVCNKFKGTFQVSGDTLIFNNINGVDTLCIQNNRLKKNFTDLLSLTLQYKIYGEFLYLYNKGKKVAVFESVYF